MKQPFHGMKILELSQTIAGPFASQLLSDLGCDVIKVESLDGDELRKFSPPEWMGESTLYLANNRNKRSISINLKTEPGLNIVKHLAKDCDIIIENFRTGTADRLGVGYEAMKEINPSIIYLSVSGFGRTGPFKHKPGYDLMMQAFSGLMGITGEPGRPPVKTGFAVVDTTTGMLGAMSVAVALFYREKTGKGQYIDCSLLDSQVMLMNYLVPYYLSTGVSPGPMGSGHPTLFPYQAFKTKDQYIVVAVPNDKLWGNMCRSLGWEDLLIDKYMSNKNRVAHKAELLPKLEERFSQKSCSEIIESLEAAGVPCSPINSIEQVVHSEQVIARELIKDIPHPFIQGLKAPVFPSKFSELEVSVRRHPPLLGEHTVEILTEYGYDTNQIAEWAKDGTIKIWGENTTEP